MMRSNQYSRCSSIHEASSHVTTRILRVLSGVLLAILFSVTGALAADPPAPKTVIVVPESNQTIANIETTFDFEGTAVALQSTVDVVEWRNNGDAWQTATGTDTWTFTATGLVVGQNLIEVRSRNAQDTNSPVLSRSIVRLPTWGIACTDPMVITASGTYEQDFSYFTQAWYSFTAPENGLLRVESANRLETGGCNNGSGTGIQTLHDRTLPTATQMIMYEGQRILLRSVKHGFNDPPAGSFSFQFTPADVQPQSTCETAKEITDPGAYHFDIGYERTNPCLLPMPPEVDKAQPWYTIWYRFTPTEDGIYEFSLQQNPEDLAEADFAVVQETAWFYLFSSESCALTCGDRIPWETTNTGGILEATANTTYTIVLTHNFEHEEYAIPYGYGILNVDRFSPATGAICADAIEITTNGLYEFSNLDATTEDPCRPNAPTQWFTYTAPDDGLVTVETCGLTTLDTYISAFAGNCPVSCGDRVAFNDDGGCGLQSRMQFDVEQGETYKIALSGFSIREGSGEFLFDFTASTFMLGDIVQTGTVNVADVTELARRVTLGDPPPAYLADINGDGVVDEADVQALADMIVD